MEPLGSRIIERTIRKSKFVGETMHVTPSCFRFFRSWIAWLFFAMWGALDQVRMQTPWCQSRCGSKRSTPRKVPLF